MTYRDKQATQFRAEMRRAAFVAGIAQSALEAARAHALICTTESGHLAEEAAARLFGAIYGAHEVPIEYVDEDLGRLHNNVASDPLQSVANHTTCTTGID